MSDYIDLKVIYKIEEIFIKNLNLNSEKKSRAIQLWRQRIYYAVELYSSLDKRDIITKSELAIYADFLHHRLRSLDDASKCYQKLLNMCDESEKP